MNTRPTMPNMVQVPQEEWEAMKAAVFAKPLKQPSELAKQWSNFWYGAISNPKTTISAIALALPVLHEAVTHENITLALSGLGQIFQGVFSLDAGKMNPDTHPNAAVISNDPEQVA